ncbi:SDR family NAD(P)-dependent oxidoreductase [Streptomyces sp. NPDC087420]|uniref:SDR family NAD(P)-dependent oxidoreductase n=1 Tax=Streptomyces sp. NPDC087420 TaxID=3365785 RepID=UPI0038387D80
MNELNSAVAVVTGATSGIGAAIARRLAEEGARVVLVGRRADRGEALAAELGGEASFQRADVTREEEVEQLSSAVEERCGRVDVLVNCAGAPATLGSVAETDVERFRQAYDVNVCGPLLMMKHLSPGMRERGSGSIVNLSSVAGFRTVLTGLDYSVSKAALLQLSAWAAVELAPYGVRVNSVSPGLVLTGIFGKVAGLGDTAADSPEAIEALSAKIAPRLGQTIPASRPGLPEEVAAAVLYLAGPASAFVNGHNLVLDGGQTLGQPYEVMRAQRAAMAAAFQSVARS